MMNRRLRMWNKLLHEEEGVTAIEYGLLAALVAMALLGGATLLGVGLNNIFNAIGTSINDANISTLSNLIDSD